MTETVMHHARYRLMSPLGEGGMGAVFQAYDRLTGQNVALKRITTPMPSGLGSTQSGINSMQMATRTLAHEFQALASLRHPNIIPVLDYGFDKEGTPFFTMKLIHDAKTIVEAGRGQSFEKQAALLSQLLQAVMYIHRRGLLHRDLKPSNILVTHSDENGRSEHVWVVDFGLVVKQNALQDVGGTLAYIAPEVLDRGAYTLAADLYAIGVVAYELYTGQHPYAGDEDDIASLLHRVMNEAPNLNRLDAPQGVREWVGRLLAKQPILRYADAEHALRGFANAVGAPIGLESSEIRESFLQGARLVGREAEMLLLRDALDRAKHDMGGAWVIAGESGVGKSRLLNELRTEALSEGVLVLYGQAQDDGGLPYHMWREPLRRLVLYTELTDFEASVLKPVVPDIATLLGRPVEDAPTLIGGTAWQQRLGTTVSDVFRRQRDPVLVILEDLQWAGDSLGLLTQLTPHLHQLPVLFLCSYRDDQGTAVRIPHAYELRLRRLTRDEIAELSQSMLGEVGKTEPVVALLQRETEGNAFFVVEVVRALAEVSGGLLDVGRVTVPERVFAGGLQQVIRRNLDRAPLRSQPLLRHAAVAGRGLDFMLLDQVLHEFTRSEAETEKLDLDTWLNDCANAGVVSVQGGQWQFAHDKLREGILDGIAADERRVIARRVAAATETLYGRLAERAAVRAGLWKEAGEPKHELEARYMAAQHAMHTSHHVEAGQHYERAVTLLTGHLQEEPEAEQARWRVALNVLWGEMCAVRGDYAQAKGILREALGMARQAHDKPKIAAALGQLGRIAYWEGETGAGVSYLTEALTLARELNDTPSAIYNLRQLGNIANSEGRWADSERWLAESVQIARQVGDKTSVGRGLNCLGNMYAGKGDLNRALESYQQAREISIQVGDRISTGMHEGNLGQTYYKLGNYVLAAQFSESALNAAHETNFRSLAANSEVSLALIAIAQTDYPTAEKHLNSALDTCEAIGDMPNLMACLLAFGEKAIKLDGNVAHGALLCGFVSIQRAAWSETRARAEKLLALVRLEAQTANDYAEITLAAQHGRELDVPTAIHHARHGTSPYA